MKKILLIVLLLSVGFSQKLTEVVETYEYGNIKSITYHKKTRDGIEKVKYEEYYENGQKNSEGTFKDGKEDGVWTSWDSNGQKSYEETYKDGKLNGKRIEWYKMYYEIEIRSASETLEKTKELLYRYRHDEKYDEVRSMYQADSATLAVLQNHYKNDKNMVGRISTYKDGELISEKCWDEDGNECECSEYGSCK